jgi:LysM repeat protein
MKYNNLIFKALIFIFGLIVNCTFAFVQDSLRIESRNGKNMIVHQVGKETLYSIARRYKVSVTDIKSFNPEAEKGLKMGQILYLPIVEQVQVPTSDNYVLHKIEQGQTLYSISKIYNVKVDDIKKWNNLTTNDAKVGNMIIVGEKSPVASTPVQSTVVVEKPKTEPENTSIQSQSNDRKVEKGIIEQAEIKEGDTFYFVLHKSLEIGTVVKITNELNGNSIFARVVGKPEKMIDNQSIIQLSKIAFERLEAKSSFKGTLEYLP